MFLWAWLDGRGHVLVSLQYGQLVALEQEIVDRISSRNPGDITWWETALQQLKAHMARVCDSHTTVM